MPAQLPPHAHLGHLRKQAKDLLRAQRAGEPQAAVRLCAHLTRLSATDPAPAVSLQEAQFVIAREYGFDDWAALTAAVTPTTAPEAARNDWLLRGSHPADYDSGGDPQAPTGDGCGFLFSRPTAAPLMAGFGTAMRMIDATPLRGSRWRLSARIRTEMVSGWCGLWMRVDEAHGGHSAFDNMQGRPIQGTTDWTRYEVVLDVGAASTHVAYGVLLSGQGRAWIADLRLDAVGADVATTAAAVVGGWHPSGSNPQAYEMGGDPTSPEGGFVRADDADPEGFGTWCRSVDGAPYSGRRWRLSARIRYQRVTDWAGLWMRADGTGAEMLAFDNMEDRPLSGDGDTACQIVLDIPEGTRRVLYGLLLRGPGDATVSDLRVEPVDDAVPVTADPPAASASAREAPVDLGPFEALAPGAILVASEPLEDRDLRQRVVLVLHRDERTCWGTILNRRLGPDDTRHDGAARSALAGQPLHAGGAVMATHGYALHREPAESAAALSPGLHIGRDLHTLARRRADPATCRFYLGYVAWQPPQLARELAAGTWRRLPVDAEPADWVFADDDGEALWRRALDAVVRH